MSPNFVVVDWGEEKNSRKEEENGRGGMRESENENPVSLRRVAAMELGNAVDFNLCVICASHSATSYC